MKPEDIQRIVNKLNNPESIKKYLDSPESREFAEAIKCTECGDKEEKCADCLYSHGCGHYQQMADMAEMAGDKKSAKEAMDKLEQFEKDYEADQKLKEKEEKNMGKDVEKAEEKMDGNSMEK